MITAFEEQEGYRPAFKEDEETEGLSDLLESSAYQTTTSEVAKLLGHQACLVDVKLWDFLRWRTVYRQLIPKIGLRHHRKFQLALSFQ